jgi:hypothetical protein
MIKTRGKKRITKEIKKAAEILLQIKYSKVSI